MAVLDEDPPSGWDALTEDARESLEATWDCGVPGEASALHGRCWQLETWLRTLAYVELRARFAGGWLKEVSERAQAHARAEAQLTHMESPDSNLILSYLDVTALYELINAHWELFRDSLLDAEVWQGRVRELKQIRHRIAHFRRPHADDLPRIAQTLRDLDRPAVRAVQAYRTRYSCPPEFDDPLVVAWMRDDHHLAHLKDHALRRYDADVRITFSRRPWAKLISEVDTITGEPGYLWHVEFSMHRMGVSPRKLWENSYLDLSQARDHLVFLTLDGPSNADFAFPAASEPGSLANDISNCIQAILNSVQVIENYDSFYRPYRKPSLGLDPRVQIANPWSFLQEDMKLSMFSA